MDRRDARVLELAGYPGLVHEPPGHGRSCMVTALENLDRDLPPERPIVRQVDLSDATPRDLLAQVVAKAQIGGDIGRPVTFAGSGGLLIHKLEGDFRVRVRLQILGHLEAP